MISYSLIKNVFIEGINVSYGYCKFCCVWDNVQSSRIMSNQEYHSHHSRWLVWITAVSLNCFTNATWLWWVKCGCYMQLTSDVVHIFLQLLPCYNSGSCLLQQYCVRHRLIHHRSKLYWYATKPHVNLDHWQDGASENNSCLIWSGMHRSIYKMHCYFSWARPAFWQKHSILVNIMWSVSCGSRKCSGILHPK